MTFFKYTPYTLTVKNNNNNFPSNKKLFESIIKSHLSADALFYHGTCLHFLTRRTQGYCYQLLLCSEISSPQKMSDGSEQTVGRGL